MILLADGGSTKCDWILLNEKGEVVLKTRTQGLNPTVFKRDVLEGRLHSNQELQKIKSDVSVVHFFGAGCGTAGPTAELQNILSEFFSESKNVQVKEDMVAAAYAATDKPGIVCILGTGSN
ncbi:MAG TPA: BadF/BadG/BcrA/BcrD ATPase family protein, partial [Salinimicrobium sp.]|nr:BadF/BadG/BcrA/BcrD ATPase family protein [Salinimicrobium sp.]